MLSVVASAGLLFSGCSDSDKPDAEDPAGGAEVPGDMMPGGGETPMPGDTTTTPMPGDTTTTPGGGETTPGGESMGATIPGGGLTPPAEGAGGSGAINPDMMMGQAGSPAAAGAGGSPAVPPVTCDLPATFRWTSTQPILTPRPPQGRNFASIKDPTIVTYEGRHHVFATVFETTGGGGGNWQSVYLNFTDFAEANSAPQIYMADLPTGGTVAPQIFFFEPQNLWYLIFQWPGRYSTNPDINNPNGWSAPRPLLAGEPQNGDDGDDLGALDFWVICDDTDCHLFFSRDNGVLYRSKTPIGNFPNFSGFETVMQEPTAGLLFEASNVYKVDGTNKYLLLVEATDPRYFRSWTSESLDGPWTALADTQQNPFAGQANVDFDGAEWTDDISHGELIRSGFNQRMTINACNMQFLYQGRNPNVQVGYNLLPYNLGLLTQQ
jgi:hypothetical protein